MPVFRWPVCLAVSQTRSHPPMGGVEGRCLVLPQHRRWSRSLSEAWWRTLPGKSWWPVQTVFLNFARGRGVDQNRSSQMEELAKTGHPRWKSWPKQVTPDGRVGQNGSPQMEEWTKTGHPRWKSGPKQVIPGASCRCRPKHVLPVTGVDQNVSSQSQV